MTAKADAKADAKTEHDFQVSERAHEREDKAAAHDADKAATHDAKMNVDAAKVAAKDADKAAAAKAEAAKTTKWSATIHGVGEMPDLTDFVTGLQKDHEITYARVADEHATKVHDVLGDITAKSAPKSDAEKRAMFDAASKGPGDNNPKSTGKAHTSDQHATK